jgi:dihydroorotase
MITEMPAIIGATITPHHLFITEQDADSNPHCLCKPKAKTEDDRLALIAAAISGDPKFFAGTDSAPHPREKKDFVPKSQEAFGCFTAPAALPLYAMIFEEGGALSGLENFVRNFGRSFYGLPEPSREPSTVTLVKEPWTVPAMIRNANYEVVPFMAGETLTWRIADKRDRS